MRGKKHLVTTFWAALIAASVGVPIYQFKNLPNTEFEKGCQAVGGIVKDVGQGERLCMRNGLIVEQDE